MKFVSLNEESGLQEFSAALKLNSVRSIYLVEYIGIWLLDENGQVMEPETFERLVKLARRQPLVSGVRRLRVSRRR